MFKVPEQWRLTDKTLGYLASDSTYGNNGCFSLPNPYGPGYMSIIASDGMGWEHVSVHFEIGDGRQRTPTWDQMCHVKDMFWGEEDVVVQFHPKKSEYVNIHKNTLHLWRPDETIAGRIPTPPSIMVGPKG